MQNDFDHIRAAENCSKETIAYLDAARNLSQVALFQLNAESTFGESFQHFTRLSLLVTRRRPELGVHCILIHVMPHLVNLTLSDIKRVTVNRLVNALVADGKLRQARRVFSLMKQFLSWCVFQGLLETSPLSEIPLNKVAGGNQLQARERKLSDAEIWIFWHLWDEVNVSESTRWAARLVLCAARRPDEVLRAHVTEFDLHNDVWNQGNRNKSHREHRLPISSIMKKCIEHLIAAGQGSEWLVPSNKKLNAPVSKVLLAQALRRILDSGKVPELEQFTIRDLRRTARSYLASLGVTQEVARKIMNHSLAGIDQVYDRYDYIDEMRKALDDYSRTLESIIEQPNVCHLDHKFKGDRLKLEPHHLGN